MILDYRTRPPASPQLHFRTGCIGEAIDLVKRHHYSRRAPSNIQFIGTLHDAGGLFGDYGQAVAAVFFCIPPTRWSEPVLELSRLVRADRRVPLTSLIGKACECLRREGYDLLVSFADRTQSHHGGVYQAASWEYDGARDRRMDGLLIDGTFIGGRACNHKWGTQSPDKVRHITGRDIQPHYDEGKHLYWRALGSRGKAKASRLGLKSLPYPKPMKVAAE
jgi:hypothetical protein